MPSPIVSPLPFPPTTYDQRYFNELIRTLNLYFRQLQNPGDIVGSSLRITALPTSATGLPSGSIWVDTAAAYVLKMVP